MDEWWLVPPFRAAGRRYAITAPSRSASGPPASETTGRDIEREWATWQSTDPESPGRIDSCILVHGPIPESNKGAIVHAPLLTAPTPSAVRQPPPSAGSYARWISR
ncbi:hypothetical protein DMA15_29980 [Streptomyces sp. WAC 01529]|nr:hypothetical protein DMA15_29980 [Streptomyces sp. WAC 01529]